MTQHHCLLLEKLDKELCLFLKVRFFRTKVNKQKKNIFYFFIIKSFVSIIFYCKVVLLFILVFSHILLLPQTSNVSRLRTFALVQDHYPTLTPWNVCFIPQKSMQHSLITTSSLLHQISMVVTDLCFCTNLIFNY